MPSKILLLLAAITTPLCLLAQSDSGSTNVSLTGVTITAYVHDSVSKIPAPINVINSADLERLSAVSILPAINATPGVRMEGRTPGSYRLSIRGSSLRSPFGVRNVKIYYDGIPVSDPGGFSYLNMFGFYNFSGMQIIKGPGSSLYGAGNGGVLLINSKDPAANSVTAGFSAGSYGMRTGIAEVDFQSKKISNSLRYESLVSDGYRAQSRINKKTVSYDASVTAGRKTTIKVHALYNDLYYQTPGGLTAHEYEISPLIARPAVNGAPGAIEQKAAVFQKDLLLGLSIEHKFTPFLKNTTTLYGLYSEVDNPNIRNFSFTTDPHFGGRTSFDYNHAVEKGELSISTGVEVQRSLSTVKTYNNLLGNATSIISDDDIRSFNFLLFLQASWQYRKWIFESGVGSSNYGVNIYRTDIPVPFRSAVNVDPITPRFAALYRLTQVNSIYFNIARGYSPPTVDELAPSGSPVNTALQAEYGWNFEAGWRGSIPGIHFAYDISAFQFDLNNAIVSRKDSLGGDYYTNAGGTGQKGVEIRLDDDRPFHGNWINLIKLWASCTEYDFTYSNFTEGTSNYSGNHLPGVARTTVSVGADIRLIKKMTLSVTYFYSGSMALDDANTAYASPYSLLGAKARYFFTLGNWQPEVFLGADNILDQKYSLGNDINAAGGRYYNGAMPINFYGGLIIHFFPGT